ncbi:PepSY domain-containing protein [Acidovorax radicis]|uniref:PepSY domain-containing protein n=1 Tax=Acidovorax radicis TaxID=758826 RepID=UPI001CF7FCF9|nr:PepSY domain-containing protein [Acidovorax radicis]UCU97385.1 PepSY domain-containing protein [Acidovorax radicis]
MKSTPTLRHAVLVLWLGLAALPTWASDDCDAPLNRWQTRDAVRQMAAAQGWQIQRLKIDDGCYEIRGTDAQGRTFKAKIDPETLKVLKMKQGDHQRDRDRDRDRDRERDDEGAARHARPPQPGAAAGPAPMALPISSPTSSPTSAPGSAPRGQVE